ncbi:6-bladed beta-propeller [Parabacteroides pacaensis]|uniref:6-bladed beta-propeller n=1 Tax=Parabacteroides pacaensis TaxID=2086575 RepID=UPI000D0FB1D5|nr:6-bladed beta-propeller [Parabacteroides pacaensis]
MRYLLIIFLFAWMGCSSSQEEDKSTLPILDISRDYPVRKVKLSDIAEVEYVPLETTDESILPHLCVTFYISKNYIITYDPEGGSIFIFNRQGKFIRKINKQGQGAKEYIRISFMFVVDFENEELFVGSCPNKKIFVYSFEGNYKREIPLKIYKTQLDPLLNYNKDYLIGCDVFYDFKTQKPVHEHPFVLISKKDGTMHPAKMKIKNRITRTLAAQRIKLGPGTTYLHRASLPIQSVLQNGDEFLIADFTLDTIYSLKSGKMTPIAVQYPSVRSKNPPVIIAPEIYTDSFIYFKVISMHYDENNEYKPYDEATELVWNRRTNKIEKWQLYNLNDKKSEFPIVLYRYNQSVEKNTYISFYNADVLIGQQKAGYLFPPRLKEIVSHLEEEDNRVLVITKFK